MYVKIILYDVIYICTHHINLYAHVHTMQIGKGCQLQVHWLTVEIALVLCFQTSALNTFVVIILVV